MRDDAEKVTGREISKPVISKTMEMNSLDAVFTQCGADSLSMVGNGEDAAHEDSGKRDGEGSGQEDSEDGDREDTIHKER